jgi:hypothetical protein
MRNFVWKGCMTIQTKIESSEMSPKKYLIFFW